MKIGTVGTTAVMIVSVLIYLMSFPLSITEAQDQGQTLNGPEDENLTSSEKAFYDQASATAYNQTTQVINGTSGTSANGTTSEMPNSVPQQQLQPLQQQEQPPLQSPPPLQQQPLPPPITQPLPQQPFTSMPPTIPISIVLGAATNPNQAFQPSLLYVNIGTTITWINYDRALHTVTSGSLGSPSEGLIFDSGILGRGATFSLNFVQYGTFPYHCTLHPQMVGTVVVS